MILGMGPIEAAITFAVIVSPVLLVLYAVIKEQPVADEPRPPQANLVSRVWWLYRQPFHRFATVRGRSSTREYWTFTVVNSLVGLALSGIDVALGIVPSFDDIGILYGVFSVSVLIPGFTVTVRRLHDTNRTGWWILIVVLPLVGWLIMLFMLVGRGTEGENRFGCDPREMLAPASE